jgi:hypothetical protein
LVVAGDLTGGVTTLGDAAGDLAQLAIASTGTWDIADDSGIGLGGPAPSSILNSGLFEKTGGSGSSAIAPQLVNNGSVLASSGTLDLQGAVGGIGTDTISGASTLEFDSTAGGGQTAGFTGVDGTLDLIDPQGVAAKVSGFAASDDSVELSGDWVFSQFSETGAGNMGTLTLTSGANQLSLNFLGDYTSGRDDHYAHVKRRRLRPLSPRGARVRGEGIWRARACRADEAVICRRADVRPSARE